MTHQWEPDHTTTSISMRRALLLRVKAAAERRRVSVSEWLSELAQRAVLDSERQERFDAAARRHDAYKIRKRAEELERTKVKRKNQQLITPPERFK